MASIAMDTSDDYVEEEEEDTHEFIQPEQFLAVALLLDFTGYRLADQIEQAATAITTDIGIIPGVGVVGASDDSELAAVAEALETAEAPSDDVHGCPICLEDDDTAVWKETPCGHRFHGRCVERWLHAKGSCPMCRRQLVATMPTAEATNAAAYLELVRAIRSIIFASHSQDGVNSTFMEEEEELLS